MFTLLVFRCAELCTTESYTCFFGRQCLEYSIWECNVLLFFNTILMQEQKKYNVRHVLNAFKCVDFS